MRNGNAWFVTTNNRLYCCFLAIGGDIIPRSRSTKWDMHAVQFHFSFQSFYRLSPTVVPDYKAFLAPTPTPVSLRGTTVQIFYNLNITYR